MSDHGYDNLELNELINDLKNVGKKIPVSQNDTRLTFQYSKASSTRPTKPDSLNTYSNNLILPVTSKVENVTIYDLQKNIKPEQNKHASQQDLNRIEVDNLQKELSMVKNELAILKRSHSLAGHPIFGENLAHTGISSKVFDKTESEIRTSEHHDSNLLNTNNDSKFSSIPKTIRNNFASVSDISYQDPNINNFQYKSLTRLNTLSNYSAHRENIEKTRKQTNSYNPQITISNHTEKYYDETEDCTLQPIGKGIQTLTGSLSNMAKNENYYNPKITEEIRNSETSYLNIMKSIKLMKIHWLKLDASREECKMMLSDKDVGSFIIRIQSEYKIQISGEMIFELVLKVTDLQTFTFFDENYEYFSLKEFIGSPVNGIKLIGHAVEPIFPSLDSFVMQHLDIPLGLPCCLKLPKISNIQSSYRLHKSFSKPKLSLPFGIISKKLSGSLTSLSSLKSQVTVSAYAQPTQEKLNADLLFLGKVTVDRLIGLNAIRHAVDKVLINGYQPKHCIEVNIYCDSLSGISIIDNERILFFKKFLSASCIIYAEVDPLHRGLNSDYLSSKGIKNAKIFGVVYQKRKILLKENKVIIFAELNRSTPMESLLKFIKNNFIQQNIF